MEIKIPHALARINGRDYPATGSIFYDNYARMEGVFSINNINTITGLQSTIESISGTTDDNDKFEIIDPFQTNIVLPGQPHKILINKLSLFGNPLLTPNYFSCNIKNVRTHFHDDIFFQGHKICRLGSYGVDNSTIGTIGSRLIIESTNLHVNQIEDIIDAICVLLSFCQRIPVRLASIQRYHNDKFVSGEFYGIVEDYKPAIPMVNLFAEDVCKFITKTLPAYLSKNSNYNFHVLSHYYCKSYTEIFDESKFINASIFMEALKYHWAKNLSNYFHVMDGGIVKGFKRNSQDSRELSFRAILTDMLTDLNLPSSNLSFISNRNFLFHTGIPSQTHHVQTQNPELWNELLDLYDLMDIILLRILDFSGYIQTLRVSRQLQIQ